MNLALFDLDHTLLPIDSDYEWGQFLVRLDVIDNATFTRRNTEFFRQYQAGTLDPVEYLEFIFGILAQFSRHQLDDWHRRFMAEIIEPAIRPSARALVKKHLNAGDLVAIVTATNRFVTAPIARAFGIDHLIAAEAEMAPDATFTGKHCGVPPYGPGKVVNTKQWLAGLGKALEDFRQSYFYSDSQNDIPLLSLVTHPVATNPNAKLATYAQENGWPILNLFDD